ncbi:MAG TPA: hypothetical protein VL523_10530, partial [Terriglobia bacterium]|nr:hypothetical protein [Terriglobia bacterium]
MIDRGAGVSPGLGLLRQTAGVLMLGPGPAGVINSRAAQLSLGAPIFGSVGRGADTASRPPSSPDVWTGGTGNWSVSSNWSAGLPTSSSDVQITNSGSQVTEDVTSTINTLSLSSGNTWALNNGLSLTIDGNSISNSGGMTLNSSGNFTILELAANATLSGGGTVTMSNNAQNYIEGAATADTLTNQETIQGAGVIGNNRMTLINSGTINANQSAGMTINSNGGVTNTGTIEATGGTLLLYGTTV